MAVVLITTQYGLADISFKYDAEVVAIVKQIPSRVWDPQGKYWTIYASHVSTLARWLTQNGHLVMVNGVKWELPADPVDPSNPFKAFISGIPAEYRVSTYKALVKVFHPDMGGDMALMQKLNEAKP